MLNAKVTQKHDVSTNLFSRDDICKAVADALEVESVGYISSKKLKNGAYQLSYWIWNPEVKKWVKGSRFVSIKAILAAKLARTRKASESVKFISVDEHTLNYVTQNLHKTNGRFCTCPAYNGNSGYELYVDGFKVCKHTLAFHQQILGTRSITEMIQWVSGQLAS